MKRRLAVLVLVVAGLVGGAPAAQAVVGSVASNSYWACAGTRHIDFGACVENPLPERLPVPQLPS